MTMTPDVIEHQIVGAADGLKIRHRKIPLEKAEEYVGPKARYSAACDCDAAAFAASISAAFFSTSLTM